MYMGEKNLLYVYSMANVYAISFQDTANNSSRFIDAINNILKLWEKAKTISYGIRCEYRINVSSFDECLKQVQEFSFEYFLENESFYILPSSDVNLYKTFVLTTINDFKNRVMPQISLESQIIVSMYACMTIRGLISRPEPKLLNLLDQQLDIKNSMIAKNLPCAPGLFNKDSSVYTVAPANEKIMQYYHKNKRFLLENPPPRKRSKQDGEEYNFVSLPEEPGITRKSHGFFTKEYFQIPNSIPTKPLIAETTRPIAKKSNKRKRYEVVVCDKPRLITNMEEDYNVIAYPISFDTALSIFINLQSFFWTSIPGGTRNFLETLDDKLVPFNISNIKKYIRNPVMRKIRKYTWNERFFWFFPNSPLEVSNKQGWANMPYLDIYFQWKLIATAENIQELKNLFNSLEVLPGGSPKDKLWISCKGKNGEGTSIRFGKMRSKCKMLKMIPLKKGVLLPGNYRRIA